MIKIAVFGSLPPTHSGISDYNKDLLLMLSEYFSIDVYIDNTYKPDPLNDRICIRTFEQYPAHHKEYRCTIFQTGNNKFCDFMIPYLLKYRGIVVLHDFNMQGALRRNLIVPNSGDFELYAKALSLDYSHDIVQYICDMTRMYKREVVSQYPSNGYFLKNADSIIVHSNWTKNALASLHSNYQSRCNIVPHYTRQNYQTTKKVIARELLNIPENAYMVATLGFIGGSKRLFPLINAVKKIYEQKKDILIYIIGETTSAASEIVFKEFLHNNGGEYVVHVGYTEMKDFEMYIDAADIISNLRYPYNGESSGTLTQCMVRSKCCLVTKIGSFDEIPDDCCIKLPIPDYSENSKEVTDIANAILKGISDPEEISNIERRAYNFVSEHMSLETMTEGYIEVIKNYVS
jgi:glycosyltransferase involved in cell wall biosynthesis